MPTIGKWYHVVCIRDNNSVKLYVDGQLIATNSLLTTTIGTTPNYGSPTYVTFGARNDGTTNTSKYQWKVDNSNQGTNSKTFDYTSVKKTKDYTTRITVEVTDEDPCFPQKPVSVDKTIIIKYCINPIPNTGNRILIPNAFSPNGDGTNDTWEIFSTASVPVTGNSDVIVEIYNRWGELIFYSKGYPDPWNGTYKNSPVMEGTYAYVVRVDNDTVLRGTILVVR